MKKLLYLSLVLALALTLVAPSVAVAAKPEPFTAVGAVTSVTDGEPVRLGKGHAGRWLVRERSIGITFDDGATSNTMTYHANVDLLQKGNFQGRMDFEGATLNVAGHSESAVFFGWLAGSGDTIPLLLLAFHGSWSAVDGAQGHGTFSGQIVFVTDGQHILFTIPDVSSVSLFGQMK